MTKLKDCSIPLTTLHAKVSLLIKETQSWYSLIPFHFLIQFLTHSFPVHPFPTSWKHQKTTVFWCFQGVEKERIGNEWVNCVANHSRNFCFINPLPICWCWNLIPGNNRPYCLVHTHSIYYALLVKKLPLLFAGHGKRAILIVHIDQHILFFSFLIDVWYNNFLQMFTNCLSVAIVFLVNTCTKFSRKCNFWKWLVSSTSKIYLEW